MREDTRTFNPGDRLVGAEELGVGEARVLRILPEGAEDEEEALLLRTERGFVAYLNRCRHLSVPLDYGDGEVLDESGKLFQCRTHGALFRPKDGLCVSGPCEGLSLVPVEVLESDKGVHLSPGRLPF